MGALFMSPVASIASVIVAVTSAATWKLVGVRSAARAGLAGAVMGICCAAGLVFLAYLPNSFYDSIPGYTPRSWAVVVTASVVGVAASARVAGSVSAPSLSASGGRRTRA
jgi:hypothetical protein